LRRGPAFPAKIGKCEPLNCAIATKANRPAKKRVTRHLSGDAAAIELEDNFVPCHLAQVIAVWFALVVDEQFSRRKF